MKILVTGAAGFLGAECLRQLRAGGRHQLLTADRRGPVDFQGDFADESFCRRLPDVDTVIHLAAVQYLSPDLPLLGRADYFHRNNIAATRNLTVRYGGGDTHFINIGTSMMYEQTGRDIYGVASPMRGQGVYSASKIQAQQYVAALSNPTACIVPCIIAGQGRGGLFKSLIDSMTRFGTVTYPGTGAHKVHIVHVQDAAALVCTVVEQRATGPFNAASPGPLSITQWVEEIAAELGIQAVRTIRLPLAPIEALSRAIGFRLLAREQLLMLRFPHVLSVEEGLALGWSPRHTNAQIVRETARALASRSAAAAVEAGGIVKS